MGVRTSSGIRAGAGLFLVVCFLAGAAWQPAASPVGEPGTGPSLDHVLRLRAGTFDPLAQGTGWVPPAYRLSAPDPWGDFYIVQLHGTVKAGQRDALLATGARYHSYLPDNAFLMWATALQAQELSELSLVRSVSTYEPYFRITPELRADGFAEVAGRAKIVVETFGTPARLNEWVASHGGTVVESMYLSSLLEVPNSLVREVAAQPDVAWVSTFSPRTVENQNSAIIQGARQTPDAAFSAASNRLWSFNAGTGRFEGTTGVNVTVAVSDTGADTTHPAFAGKVVYYDAMGSSSTEDTYGHGTHTAGTVLGNGDWRASDAGIAVPGEFAGIAPEALLVVEDWDGPGASQDNNRMGITNAQYGAVISSNSWATGGSYDFDARTYDRLTRDSWTDDVGAPASLGAQPVLYFFSAGNAGAPRTIGSPAQGKNVVGVGSTGDNFGGVSWDTMSGFSSRGPADDGRIKPELVAPGSLVRSATSTQSGWIYGNSYGTSYGSLSGTSMSCPGAAGAAAVAWQYYRDHKGVDPSPAMMKAIMINGADEMAAYPVLGADQGFGRVNLSKSLLEQPNRNQLWLDNEPGLNTDGEEIYTYAVADGTEPVAFTLVWTDEPGSSSASPNLVNDLDMWLVAPSGSIYRGNSMDNSGNSLADGLADNLNNAEKIKISAPARGYYELHVKGKNVPVGPQNYSLAVRGNLAPDRYDIALDSIGTNAANPIEGAVVTYNVSVRNTGTRWVNGSTLTLEAKTALGTTTVRSQVLGSLAGGERFSVWENWTTVRGNVTFTARIAAPPGQTEFSVTNNALNTSFFVRGYGYAMTTDMLSNYALNPLTTLVLKFNVTQTGNVKDNLSISLTWDNYTFPVAINTTKIKNIAPGKTDTFQVSVFVPSTAKAGERMTLNIATRSDTDGRYTAAASTTVTVNHLYGFSFSMAPTYAEMPPGGTASGIITLRNGGNGVDTLNLTSIGVPYGWTFDFDRTAVTLNDNVSTTIAIYIRAPPRADAGSLFVVLVRTASDGAGPQLLNFTLNITQFYGWTVAVVAPVSEVSAGAIMEIGISAENLGNGIDEVVIEVFPPPSWNSALTRPRLVMLPYSNLTSLARVTVDQYALAGDYSIRLTFGGARNYTERVVAVHVRQVYLVEVDGPGYTLLMGQGEVITFEAVVTNLGNGRAGVNPSIHAPSGLTILNIVPSAVLERNSTSRFTFQVVADRRLAAELYNFTIDFRSGPDGNLSNPLVIRIDVHEIVEPAPDVEQAPSSDATLLNGLIGVVLVVGMALPLGYLYLRRRAAANAPPVQVIVQTDEDANSASGYDPTKGYLAGAAAGREVARPPRAPAPMSSTAVEVAGVCKNCGGSVARLDEMMGRCMSCGVEQVLRGKR